MRILISAFSCMPNLGSEPGVGWGVVREAALRHRVCVLADPQNRRYIEAETDRRAIRNVQFVFVGLPLGLDRLASVRWYGYLHYFLWQLQAYRIARRLHRERPFDVVHHVTYGNSWAPSFMGWLGIPFLWCAGGREVTPLRFYRTLSRRSRGKETVRSLAVKVLGAVTDHCTGSRASMILSPSDGSLWGSGLPVKRFLLGGLSETEVEKLGSLPGRGMGPFRIASIGRLEGWKGFGLGLMAFAKLLNDAPDSEYLIIGSGPERKFLERQATRLGCRAKVRFLDWMPRSSLLDVFAQFDVLVHPSFHEQFGYVVLEAMAAARPVVCLAAGGCGQLIPAGGGTAVPITTPERVVMDLYNVLRALALDPKLRQQEGQRARQWATEHWSWSRVGERLADTYQEVWLRRGRRVAEAGLEPAG